MKIALFYPHNLYASWYALGGYARTLRTMGHEVVDCPFPGNQVHDIHRVMQKLPSVEELQSCDIILSTFHEYVVPWYAATYGCDRWQTVMDKVPVVGRFDESMDRADLGLKAVMPELLKWATHYSFPAKQDADEYKGEWLPFGADLNMFTRNPGTPGNMKLYDIGFVGSMYQIRAQYLEKLATVLDNSLTFNVGTVAVQDLSGIRGEDSTLLLAQNYRSIRIFFCLPPMSHLLVCKVFEIMACGTFLMYPKLPGRTAQNLSIFEDGKEIVYYEYGNVAANARQIQYYLDHEEEREQIAQAGRRKVHAQYTLEQMLGKLLAQAVGPEKAWPKLTRERRLQMGIGTDARTPTAAEISGEMGQTA